ncbi:MAG: GxxExxY protein [Acidobacteria bacterium]|nr:GxxExxY protein [Acidobacteriota bacterium]
MKVHTFLGPGLLEHVYKACLAHELRKCGLRVEVEVPLPVIYDGLTFDFAYRLDMVVQDSVVLELKAVEAILDIHKAQLLSYLRLSKRAVGLLINFNRVHLRDGIHRVVNGFPEKAFASSASSAS